MEDEVLDDEEELEEVRRPRRGPPRFGSFVTIAAAILMLFGAASRVGKLEETISFFGIDRAAEQRIRHEEERLRTALTIGAVPVRRDELRPGTGSLPVRSDIQPPYRGEVDPNAFRSGNNGGRSQLSMGVQAERDGNETWDDRRDHQGFADQPESIPTHVDREPVAPHQPEYYVVSNGDTWNRIAKATLGDGKRWMEIRDANPAARSGLTVGMRLRIPK